MITPVIDRFKNTSSETQLIISGLEQEIVQLKKEIHRNQSYVDRLDSRIQQHVVIELKILKSQLKAVRKEIRNDDWDIKRLQISINEKLDKAKEHLLTNHSNWLIARMEKGSLDGENLDGEKEAPSEKEMDKVLLRSFAETVNQEVKKSQEKYQLDTTTDLKTFEAKLQEDHRIHFAEHQDLFKKGLVIQKEVVELIDQLKQKVDSEIEEENFNNIENSNEKPIIDNPFKACQKGDIRYLKQAYFKKHFHERKKFANQTFSIQEEAFNLLHFASFHGRFDIVQLLVKEWKVDISAPSAKGYTALHWAAKGAQKTKEQKRKALEERTSDVAGFLLQQKGGKDLINAKADEYGRAPLHLAVFNGRIEMTHLLIENGADINAQVNENEQLKTALHYAVTQNNLAMVKALASYAALDVNIKCAQGFTPLHFAIENRDFEIVKSLVEHPSFDRDSIQKHIDYFEENSIKEEDPFMEEIMVYLILKIPTIKEKK